MWEAAIRLLHVPAYIVPAPSAILLAIRGNWRGLLWGVASTGAPMLLGYIAAIALGLPTAFALASAPRTRAAIAPFLAFVQIIPLIAVAPLLIIWFGFGLVAKTLLVFLLTVIPLSATPLPGQTRLQPLFRACKTAAAAAASTAIVADFVASDRGLGYLLLEAGSNVDTTGSFAALAVLCGLGLALYGAVALLERLLRSRTRETTP